MAGSPRPGPGSVAGGVTARTRWRAPYSSQQRAALGRRLGTCLLAPEVHSHPEASSPSLGPLRGQGCQGCSPKPSQTPDPRAQSHQLHRNPDVPAQTRAFPEGMRDPARATCQHLRGRGVGLLQPGWGWGRQPRRAHAPHATHPTHTNPTPGRGWGGWPRPWFVASPCGVTGSWEAWRPHAPQGLRRAALLAQSPMCWE